MAVSLHQAFSERHWLMTVCQKNQTNKQKQSQLWCWAQVLFLWEGSLWDTPSAAQPAPSLAPSLGASTVLPAPHAVLVSVLQHSHVISITLCWADLLACLWSCVSQWALWRQNWHLIHPLSPGQWSDDRDSQIHSYKRPSWIVNDKHSADKHLPSPVWLSLISLSVQGPRRMMPIAMKGFEGRKWKMEMRPLLFLPSAKPQRKTRKCKTLVSVNGFIGVNHASVLVECSSICCEAIRLNGCF